LPSDHPIAIDLKLLPINDCCERALMGEVTNAVADLAGLLAFAVLGSGGVGDIL
jgi:hypothetical protein